jgi:carbonic anhydrase
MIHLSDLFARNRAWAEHTAAEDPTFFQRLVAQQAPRFLWIGCSDSRVPANEITGLAPGEVFVHRNIANVVVHTDLNCLSVLQYAVEVLKVEHIIVCGHYGCGGVLAAMQHTPLGLIDNWLRNLRDIHFNHQRELDALPSDEARLDRMCELNVVHQVENVAHTNLIQDAWRRRQRLIVHGWIYCISDGLLKDLKVTKQGPGDISDFYRLDGSRSMLP